MVILEKFTPRILLLVVLSDLFEGEGLEITAHTHFALFRLYQEPGPKMQPPTTSSGHLHMKLKHEPA